MFCDLNSESRNRRLDVRSGSLFRRLISFSLRIASLLPTSSSSFSQELATANLLLQCLQSFFLRLRFARRSGCTGASRDESCFSRGDEDTRLSRTSLPSGRDPGRSRGFLEAPSRRSSSFVLDAARDEEIALS
ncbi:unnamed protein product [Lasius platythorax]|uniref:Uncharacterized protein n=1 Tax=Lasius platythorax TaxID=488582 RepID=A0AAV2P9Z4_9HYME